MNRRDAPVNRNLDADYTPLLPAKLYLPQLRPGLVARHRLLERLHQALHVPLTIVAAPAGFGKTTLLASWLVALAEWQKDEGRRMQEVGQRLDLHPSAFIRLHALRVAWLSLDADDNDPARFVAYLTAALRKAQVLTNALPTAALQHIHDPQQALVALLDDVAHRAGPVLLVLDDYHLLTARVVHDLMLFLIEHCPPSVHVLIAGRADPPLPLARLRACGQLCELRAADLRFTDVETAAFLQTLMGGNIPAAALAALEQRTEGWAAGLQLAALALGERLHDAAAVADFSGSHHYIFDYLSEELLDRQSPEVQQFLLCTSVLEQMCADLCDDLLERTEHQEVRIAAQAPGAQSLIEHLERANLFLVPLDDERRWYRYHHLFADLLRYRLQQRAPHLINMLHRRAAAWYARHGLLDAAIRHALAGNDVPYAATLIEQAGRGALRRGEVATLRGWLDALPTSLSAARPGLELLRAWTHVWEYRPDAVDRCLAHLAEPEDSSNPALCAEILALRAFVLRADEQWSEAIACSEAALAAAAASPYVRGFVAAGLGDLYWLQEKPEAAIRYHSLALEAGAVAADLVVMADALQALGQFCLLQGKLHAGLAHFAAGAARYADYGRGAQPFVALLDVGRAGLLFERYELTAARSAVEHGLAQIDRCGMALYRPFVEIDLARIAAAQGDAATAQAALQYAHQGWQRMTQYSGAQRPTWVTITMLREVEVLLLLGDQARLCRWLLQHWQPVAADATATEIILGYALAQALIACHNAAALAPLTARTGRSTLALAHDLIAACMERFCAWGLWGIVVELHTLAAIAALVEGDVSAMEQALSAALALAAPEGIARPFVSRGLPMAQALRHYAAQAAPGYAHQRFIAHLLNFFPADTTPEAQANFIETLTRREREVLELLAAGQSHRAIAATLTIAPDTARTHIKNIYGKLQAQNRVQALERARAYGLVI